MTALTALEELLLSALEGMVQRHSGAVHNWTQAAIDCRKKGQEEDYHFIRTQILSGALNGWPIDEAKAAIALAKGVAA